MSLFRRIFLVCILCIQFLSLGAQMHFNHDTPVSAVLSDNKGLIYFLDANNKVFQLKGRLHEIDKLELEASAKSLRPQLSAIARRVGQGTLDADSDQVVSMSAGMQLVCREDSLMIKDSTGDLYCRRYYAECINLGRVRNYDGQFLYIDDDTLKSVCGDFHLQLRSDITDFCMVGHQVVISTGSKGLFVYESSSWRRLFIPGIRLPERIDRIEYESGILWILTMDEQLYSFEYNRQILRLHAENVSHFCTDLWNVLWTVQKRKEIWRDNQFANQLPPVMNTFSTTYDGITIENPTQLEMAQGSSLQLQAQAQFNPDPQAIRYQYRMDNSEWSDFDQEVSIKVSAAGVHMLDVRAYVADIGYAKASSMQIFVNQSLLSSDWSYVFAALVSLIVLLIGALLKNSMDARRRKLRRNELEMKLELLTSRQKFRQAQMNPHFIFNALNAIRGLVADGQNKQARMAISEFSRLLREQLEMAEKDRVTLSEELAFLESYLKVEQYTRPYAFSYTLRNEGEDAMIAPMMIQPFVENALIHGLPKAKEAARIEIIVETESRYVKVYLIDNGTKPFAEKAKNSDHKSRAIDIFTKRCGAMDKWKTGNYFSLQEIVDEDGGKIGTRCILKIPKL